MVKNKVNDMFEQQQDTGRSASLAKKYANVVAQLSDSNDRAARAEHDLQVERITRQGLIDDEVARRAAAAEERIRLEVAKTEHSHPLGMVVSTHFRCGKGVKRGLKNGALPFNID